MAKIIVFGNRKGGVAKTTTTASVAYLLALKGFKVLATEVDSQGNLTDMITLKDSRLFSGTTVFEAIKNGNAEPYIISINENLDLLPANKDLAGLQDWLYVPGNLPKGVRPQEALKRALEPIRNKYDYILIDTPPAFGDELVNAISAATHVIGCTEASKPSMTGLSDFIDVVKLVQDDINPNLQLLGIVTVMLDSRRSDNQSMLLKLQLSYEGILFNTIIRRSAATGRLYLFGFDETKNPELQVALKQFIPLLKEVLTRG